MEACSRRYGRRQSVTRRRTVRAATERNRCFIHQEIRPRFLRRDRRPSRPYCFRFMLPSRALAHKKLFVTDIRATNEKRSLPTKVPHCCRDRPPLVKRHETPLAQTSASRFQSTCVQFERLQPNAHLEGAPARQTPLKCADALPCSVGHAGVER